MYWLEKSAAQGNEEAKRVKKIQDDKKWWK